MAASRKDSLTDQQRRAIDARDVSVALSAGAGCGKTFVLTRRFLAQLEPAADAAGSAGVSPALDVPLMSGGRDARAPRDARTPGTRLSQIVAITFTERAAREMRDRIRAACRQRLLECPENEVQHWSELIRELDSARISTIHSFCASLLRSHAVEARLDPRFRVLDAAGSATLLYEVLDAHLRERLAAGDEPLIDLLVQYNLDRLNDMIAALLAQRQEIDWAAWREETPDALVARWTDYWRTYTLPAALRQIAESAAAREVLAIATERCSTHESMQARRAVLLDLLPKLAASGNPAADLIEVREAAKIQGDGGKKAWPSEDDRDAFKDAAKELRDTIDKFLKRGLLDFDAAKARPAAVAALRILSLADGAATAYHQHKQELAVLDFDDLLIEARRFLCGAGVPPASAAGTAVPQGPRKRLAAQLRLLLVDEFQDTDPLQVELVEALCDDELLRGKLFFVGDYKQSIYRFRGADPHVFRSLRERIPAEGRLPLSLNFRSQPAVLEFVNALFARAMGPDYEPLRAHRAQVAPRPAVEFLWAGAQTDATRDAAETESAGETARRSPPVEQLRRIEADWIARRIRGLLESGEKIVYDAEAAKAGAPAARAAKPGDIAILFRALSNVEFYEEALRRYDIPYYLVGGHAFYSQQEVFDLVNLLRAVSDPADAVSLVGALRSPLFGLYDETLFWLSRHADGLDRGLIEGPLPAEIDGDQRRRAEFAAATLEELRAMKDRVPVARLITAALARTGYDAALLAEFLGGRKLANLQKLVEQARSFDRSGLFTLSDFITQLSQFVAKEPKEALAATHAESTDVVRLMTIHQSKGLEFPVVVVPDVDAKRRSNSGSIAFTPALGPMVKAAEDGAASGFDLFALAEGEEELAELTRLLYVATTRAADYLILSSGVPELGSTRGPWTELLARQFDLLSGVGRVSNSPHAVGRVINSPLPQDELETRLTKGDELETRLTSVRVTTTPPHLTSKPAAGDVRRNVLKIIEKAQQMAAEGAGRMPKYLAPIRPDAAARRQYSFSRLTGELRAPHALPSGETAAAAEEAEPTLDPRGLGTLVHAVLSGVEFAAPGDLAALVARHAPRHLPEFDEAAPDALHEPIDLIGRFLASPRAAQIAAAAEVHTELEFLLRWPPEARESDGRYLQGFIDCLYRDAASGWHLVDYKTNRVSAERVAEEAAAYEMQMLVYALAVERILKSPPVELALCFLRPGVEHHFPWDAAARQRAVEMVEQAMAPYSSRSA